MSAFCCKKINEKQSCEYASSDNNLNDGDTFVHAYCGTVLDLVVIAELKTDSLSLCEDNERCQMESWNGDIGEHLVVERFHVVVRTTSLSLHILNPLFDIIRIFIIPNPIKDECCSSHGNNAEPRYDTDDENCIWSEFIAFFFSLSLKGVLLCF